MISPRYFWAKCLTRKPLSFGLMKITSSPIGGEKCSLSKAMRFSLCISESTKGFISGEAKIDELHKIKLMKNIFTVLDPLHKDRGTVVL